MDDLNLEEPLGPEAELKQLLAEKELLEAELAELKKPEIQATSKSCEEIISVMKKLQDEDGFVINPAGQTGEVEKNPFHASAPSAGSGGGSGCCTVQ